MMLVPDRNNRDEGSTEDLRLDSAKWLVLAAFVPRLVNSETLSRNRTRWRLPAWVVCDRGSESDPSRFLVHSSPSWHRLPGAGSFPPSAGRPHPSGPAHEFLKEARLATVRLKIGRIEQPPAICFNEHRVSVEGGVVVEKRRDCERTEREPFSVPKETCWIDPDDHAR
jgi:hypothetical protein